MLSDKMSIYNHSTANSTADYITIKTNEKHNS